MSASTSNQGLRLLKWLETEKQINPLTAWTQLGIYRLGARIWDLKKLGYRITTNMTEIANRWGETCRVANYVFEGYPLVKPDEGSLRDSEPPRQE